MRRFTLALSLALVVAAILAATASAAKPLRVPAQSGPIDLPAGIACSFPVHGEVVVNRQVVTTFSDGSWRATGAFVAAMSNALTGKSITLNVPGSVAFFPNPDGTTTFKGTGQNIYFFGPGEMGPGQPGGLFLLDGLTTWVFDAQFNIVPGTFRHNGGVTNLCLALT